MPDPGCQMVDDYKFRLCFYLISLLRHFTISLFHYLILDTSNTEGIRPK